MKFHLLKRLRNIFICILIGVVSMLAIFGISQNQDHYSNGFNRLFPPHIITPEHVMDLAYNSYYFSGVNGSSLYLGNHSLPNHLLAVNTATFDTVPITLDLPSIAIIPGMVRLYVHGEMVFFTEGHHPLLLVGDLKTRQLRVKDSTTFFIAAKAISPHKLVYKIFNGQQSVLATKNIATRELRLAPKLLTKQKDGIFDMDGQLHVQQYTKKIVYVYRYRNQFLVSDSTLTNYYKARTIDTTTIAKITLHHLDNGQTQLSTPPVEVNKNSAVSKKYLFVHSGLKANNGNFKAFVNHAVIDVYRLLDGKYLMSFYLPRFKGQFLTAFTVHQEKLYVLNGRYLVSYKLHLPEKLIASFPDNQFIINGRESQ